MNAILENWRGIILGLGFVFLTPIAVAAPHNAVVLQVLDKVTARVYSIRAPLGETVRFGTLEIIVRHCDKRPPEETPESTAFVDIWEARRGEPAVSLFRGWMFASSPALSALEHPVYDVWVVDCEDKILDDADSPLPAAVPNAIPNAIEVPSN